MARTRKTKKKGSKEFDPTRWAHAVFMLFAFMSMWMFAHLVEDVWAFSWSKWPADVPRPTEWISNAVGIGIGLLIVVVCWRVEKYFKFVCEVATEVSQIIWPTRAETKAATIVVVVITLIVSGLLWGMDTVWSRATDYLYAL